MYESSDARNTEEYDQRLHLTHDEKKYRSPFYFGKVSPQNNQLTGKGIKIYDDGDIRIGRWEKAGYAPDSYIDIFSRGNVDVGEYYETAKGKIEWRCIEY